MSVQTSIGTAYGVGFAGMRADTSPCDTLSRYNRQGAAIPFGVALVKGSGDKDVKLPGSSDTATTFLGLSEFTHAYKNYDLTAPAGIPVGGMVDLARKGRYLVKVEDAVSVGGLAYFRITATGSQQLGAFRGTADSATAVSSGFRFVTAADAAGLAVVDLNLP